MTTTDAQATVYVALPAADTDLVAEALEQRAAARLRAARVGAGELAGEERTGKARDVRPGAVAIFRMLAEADALTAAADAVKDHDTIAAIAAAYAETDAAIAARDQAIAAAAERDADVARLLFHIADLEARLADADKVLTDVVDEPAAESTGVDPVTDAELAGYTVAALVDHATTYPSDAARCLAIERAGKARTTAIDRLEALVADAELAPIADGTAVEDGPAELAEELADDLAATFADPATEAATLAAVQAAARATAEAALDALTDEDPAADVIDLEHALDKPVDDITDEELAAIAAGDTGALDNGNALDPDEVPAGLSAAAAAIIAAATEEAAP